MMCYVGERLDLACNGAHIKHGELRLTPTPCRHGNQDACCVRATVKKTTYTSMTVVVPSSPTRHPTIVHRDSNSTAPTLGRVGQPTCACAFPEARNNDTYADTMFVSRAFAGRATMPSVNAEMMAQTRCGATFGTKLYKFCNIASPAPQHGTRMHKHMHTKLARRPTQASRRKYMFATKEITKRSAWVGNAGNSACDCLGMRVLLVECESQRISVSATKCV